MGKIFNPYECCYKDKLSYEDLRIVLDLFVGNHEYLRNLPHEPEVLCNFLVQSLRVRYPRVRLYVADPREKTYYGYLSVGMDKPFKEKFDIYPEHPYKKTGDKIRYEIKFEDVPIEGFSEKVTGTEETYILCKEKINHRFPDSVFPDYVRDLGFGTLINHSLTVHIMAANSVPLGAVSIDFGNVTEKFTFEECQILDSLVGTYFGRIISPLLTKDYKAYLSTIQNNHVTVSESPSESKTGFSYGKNVFGRTNSIVYNSADTNHPLKHIFDFIERVKDTGNNILIFGETGTGKELIADAIQSKSNRSGSPYIKRSCIELTDSMLQGELFGYAPRSGAANAPPLGAPGFFESADGGTIFIDEVGKASEDFKKKILRVIEYRTITRLGNHRATTVDTRLIFAANETDIEAQNEFFFRLGMRIDLPPLRERKDDIVILISYFVSEFMKINQELFSGPTVYINPETLSKIMTYDWPGNIRELKVAIEQALVEMKLSDSVILDKHLSRINDFSKITPQYNFGSDPIQIYPWPEKQTSDESGALTDQQERRTDESSIDDVSHEDMTKIVDKHLENLKKGGKVYLNSEFHLREKDNRKKQAELEAVIKAMDGDKKQWINDHINTPLCSNCTESNTSNYLICSVYKERKCQKPILPPGTFESRYGAFEIKLSEKQGRPIGGSQDKNLNHKINNSDALMSDIEIKCKELLKKAAFKEEEAIKEIDRNAFLRAYEDRFKSWGEKTEKDIIAIREAYEIAKISK
jgi:transcriptional regulator with GAF, ATPase, and Fis domain